MLRLILINVAVTTAVSFLVSYLYANYLHRCEPPPEMGEDPRRLERLQRRVGGGVVTAGADVLKDEIVVEVRRWPDEGAGPS